MPSFSHWIRASRLFSVTASIVPVLLAFCLCKVLNPSSSFLWSLFVPTLFAAIFAQIAANMISDYFDYKKGVDRPGTLGSSGVLVGKIMAPETLLKGGVTSLALSLFLGISVALLSSHPSILLAAIALGFLLVVLYTAPIFPYKYHALGELGVFLGFGPLLVAAAFFVAGGEQYLTAALYSLPISYLVVGILLANNIRDIESDQVAHISTFAIKVGRPFATGFLLSLLILPYVTIIICVLAGAYSPWTLSALITLPISLMTIKNALAKDASWSNMDEQVAKLHLLFGVIYSLSLFGEIYFG